MCQKEYLLQVCLMFVAFSEIWGANYAWINESSWDYLFKIMYNLT